MEEALDWTVQLCLTYGLSAASASALFSNVTINLTMTLTIASPQRYHPFLLYLNIYCSSPGLSSCPRACRSDVWTYYVTGDYRDGIEVEAHLSCGRVQYCWNERKPKKRILRQKSWRKYTPDFKAVQCLMREWTKRNSLMSAHQCPKSPAACWLIFFNKQPCRSLLKTFFQPWSQQWASHKRQNKLIF